MQKFREGDVVTIEATIVSAPFKMEDGDAKVQIKFPPYHNAYVDPAQLTMKRSNIVVGDRIAWTTLSTDYTGTVLAVTADRAWVDRGGGEYSTVWLPKVTRIDPEPVAKRVVPEPVAAEPPSDGPYETPPSLPIDDEPVDQEW